MNSSPSIIGFVTTFRSKLIYGLALIFIAFPAHSAVENGAQLEHVRLQLKWLHQFQFAGYYAAIEQGYYTNVGLEVELFENAPGINVVDQVVSGRMDYGIGDSGILAHYANGHPIKAIAAIFQHDPLVFISKQTSGIISPYEMAGKRIMFDAVNANEAPLRAMLAEAGLTEQHYTLVEPSFGIEELLNNQIDVMFAYLTDQPYSLNQRGVEINVINPQSYGIDFYGDLLFTSEQELRNHPGRAERLRSATLKGWRYALENPEQLIQLIKTKYHSKLSVEHLRFEANQTRNLVMADSIPLGRIDVSRMHRVAKTYSRLKLTRKLNERELANFIFRHGSSRLDLTEPEREWLKSHTIIRVGINRDFAPLGWINKKGKYIGYSADYLRILEQRLGIRFQILKDKTWDETRTMAKNGDLHLLASVVKTPSDERFLDFTDEYLNDPVIIVNKDDRGFIDSLDNLKGMRVAVEKGYFTREVLAANHPEIELLSTGTTEQALRLVDQGMADAYIGNAAAAHYTVKKSGFHNLKFSGQTDYRSAHRIGIVKPNAQLSSIIKKALASISMEERNDIANRWVGLKIEPSIRIETVIKYGGFILTLFLLFAYWIFRLRRSETALRASENKLKTIFEAEPECVKIVDANGRLVQINQAGLEMIDALDDASQVLGHQVDNLVIAEDRQTFNEMHQQVINGEARTLEFQIQGLKGTRRWMETHAVPLVDSLSGQVSALSVTRDITVRKRSDEKLKQSEARYRDLFNNAPIAYLSINHKGKILNCNYRTIKLLGYPYIELIGKDIPTIFAETPDEKNHLELILRSFQTGQNVKNIELQLKHQNGSVIWAALSANPVTDEDGKVIEIRSAMLDITQRKRYEQRELSRNQVLELIAKGALLGEILEAIVKSVEKENPSMLCSILLLDIEGKHLTFGAAPSLPDFYNDAIQRLEIGPEVCSSGAACYTGQRVIVSDNQSHPNWVNHKDLAAKANLLSCWSEPIRSTTDKILGSFAIYHQKICVPTDEDIVLIEHAANLAGIAIERSQAEEALQIANMVYHHTGEGMLVTDANNHIIAINPAFSKITGYSLEEMTGKNPEILIAQKQDNDYYSLMSKSLEDTGHWQGEIWNTRKNGEEFAEWITINTIFDETGKAHQRVALFSDITEKKKNEAIIWNQANYDALTELPNRRMFCDRLTHDILKAKRSQQPLALMFLDLDHFKEINDRLGHDMGDILLIETAKRICRCVRKSDTVSRLGGDEFTIILPGKKDTLFIERIAQSIIKALKKPFKLGNDVGFVSASIGISVFPHDAEDMEGLLKNADLALYLAKDLGRGRFSYFTKEMQFEAQQRQGLISDLRNALGTDQFQLHFQPIIDLKSGKIHKAEALLRWRHPTRGYVSPDELIPLAEESGLIAGIGDWVFKIAAEQLKQWQDLYAIDFQISINKSPAQFKSKIHHADWIRYLADLGLSGNNIVVEITEGLLMGAEPSIVETLRIFRDAGIHVAVDDFGTGYSSLAYLKKFDVNYLKIDQSFIQNLALNSSNMALSEAIIVMSHKLGLKVIAEGVETEEQKKLLTEAGCDYAQGYLFSQPLPSKEFEALFKYSTSLPG